MFCQKCGKELAEDVKFCDGCGAPVDGATQPAAPKVATPNPMVENFLKTLKGFFSKNTTKSIGDSAKSTGLEWVLVSLLSILTFAIAIPVNLSQLISAILGPVAQYANGGINYFLIFFYALLGGIGVFFLLGGAVFATVKFIFKKEINIHSVFNLVAAASIPMAIAYVLNILFGFFLMDAVIVFFAVGVIATAVLLYIGIQKLAKFESSPYLAFVAIWAVVIAIIMIVISIVAKNAVNGLVSSATGMLGSLGSMF